MRRLLSLVGVLLLAVACRTPASAEKRPGADDEATAAALAGVPSDELLLALAAASANDPGGYLYDDGEAQDDAPFEESDGDTEGDGAEAEEDIAESREVDDTRGREDVRYTRDLSDTALLDLWQNAPEKLGSLSIGFVDEGRLLNGKRFPDGDGWVVVSPDKAYATEETIDYVIAAIRKVREQYPDAPPLRINQLSVPEGGFLRPHKSHQNGRDVDLGFYYPTAATVRARARERVIHPARNWALVKALLVMTDVQYILVDKRIQRVLYRHALRAGEDKAWLRSLFRSRHSPIRHARGHRDHFHVRFYNPRAQELARRLSPFFAFRPELNARMHRVRKGETLARIARKYGVTVTALKRANRLKNSKVRVSRMLKVPTRGACSRCPVPPPVVLPARHFPPGMTEAPVLANTTAPAQPQPQPDDATPAEPVPNPVPAPARPAGGDIAPASGSQPGDTQPAVGLERAGLTGRNDAAEAGIAAKLRTGSEPDDARAARFEEEATSFPQETVHTSTTSPR